MLKRIVGGALILALALLFLSGCGYSGSKYPVWYSGWAVGCQPEGGYGTIIHTADSGRNWLRQGSSRDIPAVALNDVCALSERTAWVVGDSDDGYGVILRTDNGGRSWVRQGDAWQLPDCSFTGIRAVNDRMAWVAGTEGVIMKTVDGGANWSRIDHGQVPGDGLLQSVWGVDEKTAWVSGATGAGTGGEFILMKTVDGGESWVRQGSEEQLAQYICIIETAAADAENAWGMGAPQEGSQTTPFLRTVDGGENWVNQAPDGSALFHANGLCVVNAATVWVAQDERILLTTDGGDSWSRFAPPGPYGDFSPFMGVSAVNSRIAWVVFNGLCSGDHFVIQYTDDGGRHWTQQATPVTQGGLRRISMAGAKR